jgi:hypothetical protein
MPKKKQKKETNPTAELLKALLIVELSKAGVPQLEIRKIVGGGIHRVNRIVKLLKKGKSKPE